MNRNTRIPHSKLALPTTKQVGISIDLVLSLAKTKQPTLMEINFRLDNCSKAERINLGFLLSRIHVP
jgi:hypothetical protein